MSDIVLYYIAIAAFAFEIIKYFKEIPAKYIRILLIIQLLSGVVYCVFAFDVLGLLGWYLLSAPLIAYGTYLVSLFIVGTKFNKENLMVKRVRFDPKLQPKIKAELLRNLLSSSVEEIVFRAVFQFALTKLIGNVYIPAIIVCILFTAAHYKKNIAIVQMLDILFFGTLIVYFLKWCDVGRSKEKRLYKYFCSNYRGRYHTLVWSAISKARKDLCEQGITDRGASFTFQQMIEKLQKDIIAV